MNKILQINTDRLAIQPLSEADYVFIFQLVNTKGWLTFIGDRNVRALSEAGDYIRKILNTETVAYWVVRLKQDQTPVGVVTFIQRDYLEYPDIGFAFLPQFSGNGYAYEATKAVLDRLIAQENLSRILATTIPENVKSIRLLEKIGLAFEREIKPGEELLHLYGASVEHITASLT